ncbi:MAG: phosphotransferase [Candidatus Latescibacteria bacterium]|nr:phosphotransferase [Candidatus Latescibacterota bacterium]
MDDISAFTKVAERCLAFYDLPYTRIDFIRHNENATFYVELAARRRPVVLRLHQPAISGLAQEHRTPQALESVLEWMESIAENTDLTVQKPVRSKDGSLVVAVEDDKGAVIHCSISEWIDGDVLDQEHGRAADHVRAFGAVVAKLQNYSSSWSPPAGFCRPCYGAGFLSGVADRLRLGFATAPFDKSDFVPISRAIDKITSLVESAKETSDQWGLVHMDLQGGNILVHNNEVRLIDFTLCGWGSYLFESGMAISCLQAKWHPCFLSGYKSLRPLKTSAFSHLEAGAILGILAAYSYHIANPKSHEWIVPRVQVVAHDYCGKFLADQRFLLDM